MKYLLFTFVAGATIFFPFVPRAYALNQSSNWQFTGNATNWDVTNGTGTDVCGSNTSSTETSLDILSYDDNNFKGTENTTSNNVQERGRITQVVTVPGSGSQRVTGGLTYSTTGSIWSGADSSWVRMDVYDASDTTYVDTLGCASFNSDIATTTIGFNLNPVLTGGTSYRLRITLKLRNVATNGVQNIWVDNVVLTTPPVNAAASAPAATTNTSLTWDVSAATSTAPSIHATTPYKVYRGTTSGSETFLANATTNAYTDSTTVGNTTYYYWVTNLDTTSYESASSTEVSQLTRPSAPGTPSFTNQTQTSLTVNWDAPTGGADTYDVYRCAGEGCTPSSAIATDIAGLSYNDSGLAADTTYIYRVLSSNATGDGVFSATASTLTGSATRIMRLFEGFNIRFVSGKIILHQRQ